MDKILTHTGGQPVFLDDIDFSSKATRDALKGLCTALSLDNIGTCILSGCNVIRDGAKYSWTDGYIAIKGEIYKVVAGSISSVNFPFWVVKKTSTEERTFEDKSIKSVWQTTYVTLAETHSQGDIFTPYLATLRYSDLLLRKAFECDIIDVPLESFNKGLGLKMQIKQYEAFKKIIVEITELPDFENISEACLLFRFDKKYYSENIIMTSFLRKSPSYYRLSIYDDPYWGPVAGIIPLEDATLIKGFGSLKFQIII